MLPESSTDRRIAWKKAQLSAIQVLQNVAACQMEHHGEDYIGWLCGVKLK